MVILSWMFSWFPWGFYCTSIYPPTSLEVWLRHLYDALQEEWQDLYPKKPTKERRKELLSEQPIDETVVVSAPAKTSAVDS